MGIEEHFKIIDRWAELYKQQKREYKPVLSVMVMKYAQTVTDNFDDSFELVTRYYIKRCEK